MENLNSARSHGSSVPQRNGEKGAPLNRRCARRLALTLPIQIRGESPFNTLTVKGRTRNVSANGIYFVCGEDYLPGQLLHITMKLSGDMAQGTDSVFLTLRFRVQRLEQTPRNGAKQFGVAVALDA